MEKEQIIDFFQDEASEGLVDLNEFIAIAKRQWKVVAISAFVMLILGVIFVITAVPKYTATATLLMDPNNQQISSQLLQGNTNSNAYGPPNDEAAVLSQVEILNSEKIARAVIGKLDLLNDQDFMAASNSTLGNAISAVSNLFSRISSLFSAAAPAADPDAPTRSAVELFSKSLDSTRVGRTYVLEIDYTSPSPGLSTRIANAVAEAYLGDQLDAKYDATRQASKWLESRIEELRKRSLASDLAVQKFKADHNLIAAGGQLVSDQQLMQLNSQYVLAQADTSQAEAKFERIKKIVDTGQLDAAVTESLDSSVVTNLQEQYLDAARREADISSRLGADHIQAVRLRSQMQEYKRLMFEELNRIAQGYHSTLQVAEAREKTLSDQVKDATTKSAAANDDQVQLRELEREADTFRQLYETFLQRFQEATQQQSFPVTDARVITKAAVPNRPSFPKKPLILALSLVLGAGIGGAIGAYRELAERYFRSGEQVRKELGMEFLGQVPFEPVNPIEHGDAGPAHRRELLSSSSIESFVVDHPLSVFAETMRSSKIAVDILSGNRKGKIVGIVSVLPGEGKSTIAINFAQHLANQGSRTLLIDADFRNPGATRAIGSNSEKGLFEVISEREPYQNALLFDAKTRLAFMPAVMKKRIPFSSELLSSKAMEELLAQVSNDFDYIVIDLPPMGPVVDARAISDKVDNFLMVIEWGHTARRVIRQSIKHNPTIMHKCAGVILNKIDMRKLSLYVDRDQTYFHNTRYGEYYLKYGEDQA